MDESSGEEDTESHGHNPYEDGFSETHGDRPDPDGGAEKGTDSEDQEHNMIHAARKLQSWVRRLIFKRRISAKGRSLSNTTVKVLSFRV